MNNHTRIILVGAMLLGWNSASAQKPAIRAPHAPGAEYKKPADGPIDESLPMYLSTRAAMVVPVKASNDTMAIGGGAGIVAEDGSLFGLRVIWIPKPPPNVLADSAPKVSSAWGPVVEWQNLAVAKGRLSFFTNVAGGFVYGSPDKKAPDSSEEKPGKNVVLPILELGLGLRVVSRKMGNFRTFIAPELGYVVTGQAPYAAINVGIY